MEELKRPCQICRDHKPNAPFKIRDDDGILYKTSFISNCPYCGRFLSENYQQTMGNKPLTLDELRQMVGEPVYLVYPNVPEMDGWQILKGIDQEPDEDGDIGAYFMDDVWESLEGYGQDLLAYARKPEGSDHDA